MIYCQRTSSKALYTSWAATGKQSVTSDLLSYPLLFSNVKFSCLEFNGTSGLRANALIKTFPLCTTTCHSSTALNFFKRNCLHRNHWDSHNLSTGIELTLHSCGLYSINPVHSHSITETAVFVPLLLGNIYNNTSVIPMSVYPFSRSTTPTLPFPQIVRHRWEQSHRSSLHMQAY